ncbi:MAG: HAD hydrolase-like protein [Ignavibacteriae bacterium]|nr:HAD hydrolase-like protein [Ignavibacteriota bacterium]
MKKLILFDIDGTLISMKRSAQRAIMEYACEYAIGYSVPPSAIPPLSGKTDKQIIREILANLEISQTENEAITIDFLEGLRIATPKHSSEETINVLINVKELVKHLHNHPDFQLALLTGNNRDCAYSKLMPTGLDIYFPFGAFGCDHHDRKKLPPIAIERGNIFTRQNHFSADTTLIIGDAPGDVSCAKANDIPVLAVATGLFSVEELQQEGANLVLKNFSNLDTSVEAIQSLLSV